MTTFEITDDAVVWRGDGETLVVQAWGESSLRVRSNPAGEVLAVYEWDAGVDKLTIQGRISKP